MSQMTNSLTSVGDMETDMQLSDGEGGRGRGWEGGRGREGVREGGREGEREKGGRSKKVR